MVNINIKINTVSDEVAVEPSHAQSEKGIRPFLALGASQILTLDGTKNSFKGNVFAAFLFATLGQAMNADPTQDLTYLSFFFGADPNGVAYGPGSGAPNAWTDLLVNWLAARSPAEQATIQAFRGLLESYRQAAINAHVWGDDCFLTYKMIRDIAQSDYFSWDK